jgi:hypothetical protein
VTDLKALMELSKKATMTPWKASRRSWRNELDENNWFIVGNIGESADDDGDVGISATSVCIVVGTKTSGDIPKDTAAYIVSACNAVPSLIQRLQAAEEERDRYKSALSGLVDRYMIAGVKGGDLWEAARLALTPPTKSEEKR